MMGIISVISIYLFTVTLGFFDDILIPVNALQHPSRFDETDQAWVWEYPKEDGEKHDLFMDSGKICLLIQKKENALR